MVLQDATLYRHSISIVLKVDGAVSPLMLCFSRYRPKKLTGSITNVNYRLECCPHAHFRFAAKSPNLRNDCVGIFVPLFLFTMATYQMSGHLHYSRKQHNWRAGASQPSRATGTIFLYVRSLCMYVSRALSTTVMFYVTSSDPSTTMLYSPTFVFVRHGF